MGTGAAERGNRGYGGAPARAMARWPAGWPRGVCGSPPARSGGPEQAAGRGHWRRRRAAGESSRRASAAGIGGPGLERQGEDDEGGCRDRGARPCAGRGRRTAAAAQAGDMQRLGGAGATGMAPGRGERGGRREREGARLTVGCRVRGSGGRGGGRRRRCRRRRSRPAREHSGARSSGGGDVRSRGGVVGIR